MREIIVRLNYLIEALPIRVGQFSEQEFSSKLLNKWSIKEIIGHLCDSATNNHHRFIRIQYEKQPFVVVPYNQNAWVAVQNYQSIPASDIVSYWTTLNRNITSVIAKIPEEKLFYLCDIG
ncbi:MAG TPA: DinB family protein, partial [Desulfosporosinus sp.]|nr:DinB family protein [Desulfosporosinus sp.]